MYVIHKNIVIKSSSHGYNAIPLTQHAASYRVQIAVKKLIANVIKS